MVKTETKLQVLLKRTIKKLELKYFELTKSVE